MNICEIISKSTVAKSDIKKLIYKTYYTNRKENYGTICLRNDIVSLENVGVGEEKHIPPEKMRIADCSRGTKKLAEIHTHPNRSLFVSEGDILDSFRRSMDTQCIAVETEFKDNRIRCYTLKSEYKNKSVYIDKLKKDIEQIVKQVRKVEDRAFKAIYSNDEKLISETRHAEKEIKDKYFTKSKELHGLMDDSLNWFDYCDLEI